MDVNLSSDRITEGPNGEPYNPGAGGWPTIRYFNQDTGIAGGEYVKKTERSMCDELGNDEMMFAYVEEYGDAYIITCDALANGNDGCDEREIGYIQKIKSKSVEEQKSELQRLEKMQGNSMKPDLLVWLEKRKKILKQLVAVGGSASGGEL